MSTKILITGANGGFGALITKTLIEHGCEVVGTLRGANGRNQHSAAELKSMGAHVIELDVTDADSVQRGVAEAHTRLGGLDVLINNAGVGSHGLIEAFTTEQMAMVFDVNVFGVHRLTRAVAPLFRQQGSGLILNISSLLGRVTVPFMGVYNASKWALEAMSENYRLEMSQFGVDVALIEPGGFPTAFFNKELRPSDQDTLTSYGKFTERAEQFSQGFAEVLQQNPQQNPQMVADAALKVITTTPGQRPFRTTVDTLGMGAAIDLYNRVMEETTQGIHTAFGNADLLQLQGVASDEHASNKTEKSL